MVALELKIDNEFKRLIPALTPQEVEQLEKNCIKDGILMPLVSWDGILVDGHNRYEIAMRHDLPFQVKEMQFDSREDVKEWIIVHQFGRRNINLYQRSVLALELEKVFAEKAKENKGGDRRSEDWKSICQNSDKLIVPIDTKKEIAKVAQVSHDTIMRVKKIQQDAPIEIKNRIQSGDMSINEAYKEVKTIERQKEVAEIKAVETKILEEVKKVEHFDFIHNISALESKELIPTGIKVLLTDPPYGQGFISNRRVISEKDSGIASDENIEGAIQLLDDTLAMYYEKMADDSFAFVFTSWRYEPQFRLVFEKYFTLRNSLIWLKSNHGSGDLTGSFAPKHERILFGVKGNPKLRYRLPDVIEGNEIITNHPTAKPIDLLSELIMISSTEGDIVADPFCGHGSTIISAIRTKRNPFGTELCEKNYSSIINNIKKEF